MRGEERKKQTNQSKPKGFYRLTIRLGVSENVSEPRELAESLSCSCNKLGSDLECYLEK